MRIDLRFVRQVALALAVAAVLLAYPLWRWAPPDVAKAVAMGAFLSTLNVLAGALAIEYAYPRSYTTFLKVVLGGMGVRLAVLLAVLALLVAVVRMHALALVCSLGGFYMLYLTLEIAFIQRKFAPKNDS
jgi:hypothetical protein